MTNISVQNRLRRTTIGKFLRMLYPDAVRTTTHNLKVSYHAKITLPVFPTIMYLVRENIFYFFCLLYCLESVF